MNLLVDKNFNIFNIQGIDIAKLIFQEDTDEFKIDILTEGLEADTLLELDKILCEWNGTNFKKC